MSRRIVQVAIAATDLKASEQFYIAKLGLTRLFEAPNVVALEAAGTRVLLTHRPNFRGTTDAGVAIYFEVEAIEPVFAHISSETGAGVSPHRVAQLDGTEIWIAFVEDPSGNKIGLLEHRPAHS